MQRAISGALGISFFAFVVCTTVHPVAAQIAPGVTQSAAQTGNITGTVKQSDGTPVAGADVRLNGPNAHLTTTSDAHGTFSFITVPYGTYRIDVVAGNLGIASRDAIVLKGDLTIAIQYATTQTVSGLKTIAHVSTRGSGAQINITPASIASITPAQYAFEGNPTWRELLNQIPGVVASIGEGVGLMQVPGAPPIASGLTVSIDGALPYETETTFDGMPLSSALPGNGFDLSTLPMPLFETADIVRGPGANAPSIVDSIGGSLVLHAPGAVDKNTFEASVSTDPYGGYFSNAKAAFRLGRLSATVVYGFNNSPGPLRAGPTFGALFYPLTINGNVVQTGGFNYTPNPIYNGNYGCIGIGTIVGTGGFASTSWVQHNGGIALSYQLTPKVTVQTFYAGTQQSALLAGSPDTILFAPDSSYAGPIVPGTYLGGSLSSTSSPISESGSLLEEKMTAYIGRGVLRLGALQNYTYSNSSTNYPSQLTAQLYGTGTYCNNPLATPPCTSTTPFVFTGQTATITCNPFTLMNANHSTNDDLLASYETQLGSKSNLGISFVKSVNGGGSSFAIAESYGGTSFNIVGSQPVTTETLDETRIHLGTQLSDRLSLDGSYYFTRGDYHVPSPNPNTPNLWVDSIFPYSAPRLGITWRANNDTVIRAAAGGGFALPPLFDLVGQNGGLICNANYCEQSITNINLQPERSFAFDIGSDMRLRHGTVLSADVYRADLYGQLYQATNVTCCDPTFHLPIYNQEFLNLGHSRFEGVNVSVSHDIPHGLYWNAELGLTRGYLISVPPGFYNIAGTTCNFTTGVNCQNTCAVSNQNFDGRFESTVPYANGSATVGYRWAARKYVDIQTTYQGNNNSYFVPAFFEFDGHAGYPLTKNLALLATFRNITGIYDQRNVFVPNPNLVANSIAGPVYPLFPLPYGPRTVTVTANFQL